MLKFIPLGIAAFFLTSCATQSPVYIDKPYGASAPYGEGIHPGIDYGIRRGTPVIAVSDGNVVYIAETRGTENGVFVGVLHGDIFWTLYGHMDKIFVQKDQLLKRGQLIGLSGASNNYGKLNHQHLHFGICKIGAKCDLYSNTYNPEMYWLGRHPSCFDPKFDYSPYSLNDLTLPVACGDYEKAMIAESKLQK